MFGGGGLQSGVIRIEDEDGSLPHTGTASLLSSLKS